MKELICIVCPRGCHLRVDLTPSFSVTGNACPRGAVYAAEETREPKRTVTATCPIDGDGPSPASSVRRVPVKTTVPVPRALIDELIADLGRTKIILPVRPGDVVIENWRETGASVVVTRGIAAL